MITNNDHDHEDDEDDDDDDDLWKIIKTVLVIKRFIKSNNSNTAVLLLTNVQTMSS